MSLKVLTAAATAVVALGVIVALIVTKQDSPNWETVEAGGPLFENMPVDNARDIAIEVTKHNRTASETGVAGALLKSMPVNNAREVAIEITKHNRTAVK